MLQIEKIIQLTKSFNVLYVEDDLDTATQISQTLKLFFKSVFYAKDGLEGVLLFQKHAPDLVITDIKMPKLNGIEMGFKIRLDSSDIPIIILSAHNELSLLHESIKLGIVSFITKPISQESLINTIYSVCQNLQNKKLADELLKDRITKELQLKEQDTILKVVDIIDSPIFIAKNEEIFYVNNAFKAAFSLNDLQRLHDSASLDFFNDFIVYKSGYLSDIKELELDEPAKIVLKLQNTKFYEIKKKSMFFESKSDIFIYTLYDITKIESGYIAIEYHKNKLKCANNLLSEFFFKNSNKRVALNKESANEYNSLLSEEQKEILNKTRHEKNISAADYLNELDSDIKDDMCLLKDIEQEIASSLDSFTCLKSCESLTYAAKLLKDYSVHINLLIEFGDLSVAIKSLALFILSLQEDVIEKNSKKLSVALNSILDDLISWRHNIFIEPVANDIHYLDASLFSSCLQLQFDILEQKPVSSDDDLGLELF